MTDDLVRHVIFEYDFLVTMCYPWFALKRLKATEEQERFIAAKWII